MKISPCHRSGARLSLIAFALASVAFVTQPSAAVAVTSAVEALQGESRITGTVKTAKRGRLLRGAIFSIDDLLGS